MNEEKKQTANLKEANLQRIKHKLIVMSGKGGVGKSTVSVNIAYALASQGYKTGLMDVDFHGPSIAKMTGIEDKRIVANEKGNPIPIVAPGNVHILTIASMLENKDSAVIWRGPMKMGIIKQFLDEFEWPELDYLIVDCPPGTGDEPLSVVQTIGDISGVVIVSTPQDVAFLDARKSISFAHQLNVPIVGLVENMSGFVCPKCGELTNIFKQGGAKKVQKDFDIEILGQIPIETDIVDSGDDGVPYILRTRETQGGKAFMEIADKIAQNFETKNK